MTPAAPTLQQVLKRVRWLKLVLFAFFVAVVARLVQIQIIESQRYKEIARRQYEVKVPLLAARGNIYDRNGRIIVSNGLAVSYAADPKIAFAAAGAIADRLARVFGESNRELYLSRLRKKDSRFVWLERRASPTTQSLIRPQQFDGLICTTEPRRIYHYEHVAAQVLGLTDVDNNGLSGIELQYDAYLRGRNGYMILQRDGLGRKRPTADYPRIDPVNGNSLVLTLDLDCQALAEEELRKGVERNNAAGGTVVMVEPATGEVLAMASYPSVNPARFRDVDSSALRNRAVTDVFEPGSLFKVVTAAAALEHRLVSPTQKFSAENGVYRVRGRPYPITDVHKYDLLTLRDAIEFSSNIVMAKVSDIIGAERLYTTARNFGFGTRTGIELPGEVPGVLKKPYQWSRTTLNSMAYGYEVSVTPLQLVMAYAAIANGGVLMKPYIVKRIISERNEVLLESRPETIRRVMSRETADSLRSFLRGVVVRGTGTATNTGIIPIAGKTGTTRQLVGGTYSTELYRASFVGMFPADEPRIVCLVVLDSPRSLGYYGASTSAPIVRDIAEKLATTSSAMARTPSLAESNSRHLIATPDVRMLAVDDAEGVLTSLGFGVETRGSGSVVMQQTPAPGERVPRGVTVRLSVAEPRPSGSGYTHVPDLRGLSLRRALNRISIAGLEPVVEGSGLVVEQTIAPGEQVKVGTRVGIRCETRRSSSVSSL